MTTEQKRVALAEACSKTPINVCNDDMYIDSCPICGICANFSAVSDVSILQLYDEAVRRGTIKERHMTTEEKRSRMTAMCRIGNKAPHNDCKSCILCSSCRKIGHPPAYMKDEAVELVFNNAVQRGIFCDELTVDEMREKLVRICDTISSGDCLDGACPISESCVAYTEHSPENASDDEIKAIFADLIRRGDFKEE